MNILLTGAWQGAKENIAALEAAGHKTLFMQYEKDALPCEYEWVEGVVCNGLFLSHPIEKFINLRYIQLTSAGFDRVPMEYVKAHNIEIHNATGVYSIPMAEFAIGGVLQMYKKATFFAENQRYHKWEKRRDLLELYGKTVCIIGCGSVGSECAKRFSAFGCRVTGVATKARPQEWFDSVAAMRELINCVSEADVIVLTLPLTEETHHIINAEVFGHFKPGAVLVNISRGAVVDTEALVNSLKTTLLGAVLDVFEEEPLAESSPLWDMENVILTPHNSFVGEGNTSRLKNVILNNLEN